MLDAKIPVPISLNHADKWEEIWRHRHFFVCFCAGRCKLISAPSPESALCHASTALNQRRCNSLLAGCVCVCDPYLNCSCAASAWTQISMACKIHTLLTWQNRWVADEEQSPISWPGVHIPADKPHCLFYEDFGHAEENNKNTWFLLY